MDAVQRITFDPEVCGGRPCVRGMRIRVADILEMLGNGVSESEILSDFPDLEREDLRSCLLYAAHCFRRYPGAANVGGATVSLVRGNARGRPAP